MGLQLTTSHAYVYIDGAPLIGSAHPSAVASRTAGRRQRTSWCKTARSPAPGFAAAGSSSLLDDRHGGLLDAAPNRTRSPRYFVTELRRRSDDATRRTSTTLGAERRLDAHAPDQRRAQRGGRLGEQLRPPRRRHLHARISRHWRLASASAEERRSIPARASARRWTAEPAEVVGDRYFLDVVPDVERSGGYYPRRRC